MSLSPNIQRVLVALGAHRTPGWQFPAHFLGLTFGDMIDDRAEMTMELGPHCLSQEGTVSLAALSVLADVAMAGAVRGQQGAEVRLATISARLNFGRLPDSGVLQAKATSRLNRNATSMPFATTTIEMGVGGTACCSGEATFAIIDSKRLATAHPLPRTSTLDFAQALAVEDLTSTEVSVLDRARTAESEIGNAPGFIDRFWGCVPTTADGTAESRIMGGVHIVNRVGDIQGGVLLGLAGQVCSAALPEDWHLVDLSAQYISASPGTGITMKAKVIRKGRHLASVACEARDNEGKITLSAQASMVRQG